MTNLYHPDTFKNGFLRHPQLAEAFHALLEGYKFVFGGPLPEEDVIQIIESFDCHVFIGPVNDFESMRSKVLMALRRVGGSPYVILQNDDNMIVVLTNVPEYVISILDRTDYVQVGRMTPEERVAYRVHVS